VSEPYWILCVDDDETLLSGLELQLGLDHEVRTASGGEEGLRLLEAHPDCAIVLSDMRMPGMSGAQLLAEVRRRHPESTRMLLTGYSEVESAISAVNEGGIFRFLTKPTTPDVLNVAIDEAIRQWELVRGERVLLEQTVRGAAQSMIEALEIACPLAFARARRIESICKHVASEVGISPLWSIGLAGLFLRLGWIALPANVLESRMAGGRPDTQSGKMFDEALHTSVRLVSRIPRLEPVAEIIAATAEPSGRRDAGTVVAAVAEADDLAVLGLSTQQILDLLEDQYPPRILDAIATWPGHGDGRPAREVRLSQLIEGMTVQADIMTTNRQLLVRTGSELSIALIQRLRNFAKHQPLIEPILVTFPGSRATDLERDRLQPRR
jgi:CheY-like chemotaxis protein